MTLSKKYSAIKLSVIMLSVTFYLLLSWMSLFWVSLCCWVSWRRLHRFSSNVRRPFRPMLPVDVDAGGRLRLPTLNFFDAQPFGCQQAHQQLRRVLPLRHRQWLPGVSALCRNRVPLRERRSLAHFRQDWTSGKNKHVYCIKGNRDKLAN